jgi:hypothetical protein
MIAFDEEGVRCACRFAEKMHGVIDWVELAALASQAAEKQALAEQPQ